MEQKRSSDVEHRDAQKRWPRLELKRLKTRNNGNQKMRNVVKKSMKNTVPNGTDDNNDVQSYTTPIAGRLCRTRLPVARF